MTDEIGAERGTGWKKAIPEERDRLQSRVLVWVVGGLLVWMGISALRLAFEQVEQFPVFVLGAIAVSLGFAVVVRMLRAATTAAAGCGGMICLLLTLWTGKFNSSVGRTAIVPLAALFALTFLSTRAGRQKKARAGLAERRRGRSASQVIANLSVSALCVTPIAYLFIGRVMTPCCVSGLANVWIDTTMKMMCLAALVEATADTVSSEIGQAFGGTPVMLLSLRRAEPGTDGAITVLGSLAGIVGGALVAAVGMWALRLTLAEAGIALAAGIGGLFFDSLLGATVERKGWLGNDLVNFASTVFAAGMALGLLRIVR